MLDKLAGLVYTQRVVKQSNGLWRAAECNRIPVEFCVGVDTHSVKPPALIQNSEGILTL